MATKDLKRVLSRASPEDWVLKVAGKEEYLLKEKRLSSYKVSIVTVLV